MSCAETNVPDKALASQRRQNTGFLNANQVEADVVFIASGVFEKRGGRDENGDVASRSVLCSYPLGLRDFSGCGTIVDVGGGHGGLIASILKKHANLKGVVYDSPQVVAGAPALFEEHGVVQRATAVGGDFFKSVPADGDTYVMYVK